MNTHARGFTLIEALIALVVLSIGLLGAAIMLLESLRAQAQSLRQVAAGNLVRDMAERIRANTGAGPAYRASPAMTGAAPCPALGCDSAQLAATDLAHFAQATGAALPAVSIAAVEFAPAAGPAAPSRFVISLRWQDPRTAEYETVTLQMLAQSPAAG